ncbi:MAG: Gfo/Idh/MocA family protein [Promethearchaeota archaeon]
MLNQLKADNPVRAILIGAGQRGADVFGAYAIDFPLELQIIAVAEPRKTHRERFSEMHNLESGMCYEKWEDLLKEGKISDKAEVAIIATPDRLHVKPAIAALEKGYDVLLEKPMATTLEDCKKLTDKTEQTGRKLQICHVLRYTKFYSAIHKLIREGKIGNIVNISMRENVSYWHYAHSFIRGNWHNREKSSPMILAKCCHDLDLLYWFVAARALKINSFGSLTYFGPNKAPKSAPMRCTDGCPAGDSCLYNAIRFYVENIPLQYDGWPVSVITTDQSLEGRMKALREGPYGKCVYRVKDHNVVDHQVVGVEFENGVTATLTMHGHSHEEGRTIRIDGTKGTIIGEFLLSGNKLILHDSSSLNPKEIQDITAENDSGHGGGDTGLIRAFIKMIRSKDTFIGKTGARESLESHLMAFAADKARLENRIVEMQEIRK